RDVIGAQTDTGYRSPGRLSDLISRSFRLLRRGGRDDHVIPGPRERLGQVASDSAGTAGDERDRLGRDRSRFRGSVGRGHVGAIGQLLGHCRNSSVLVGCGWWSDTTEPGRTTVTVDRAL